MKKPRAKFCACASEPTAKAGLKVYLKTAGVLTLNLNEAMKEYKEPVGELRKGAGMVTLKLTERAEAALSLLC